MKQTVEKWILKKTGSQDLGSGALSVATSFGKKWQLTGVYIHFDASCSQTVTVTRDSADGANYDTVLKEETLSAATDFTFKPTEELLKSGEEISVGIDSGGSATAYLTIIGKEV